MLLGNLLIGLHEQTRLQPRILAGLNAPVEDLLHRHLNEGLSATESLAEPTRWKLWLGSLFDSLVGDLEEIWRRVATETLMNLSLPGGEQLALGELAELDPPPALSDLSQPPRLGELWKQFQQAGSVTGDWGCPSDRIRFIQRFFRVYDLPPQPWQTPFISQQQLAIEQRKLPPPE